MRVVEATSDDIDYVIDHMAAWHTAEIEAAGLTPSILMLEIDQWIEDNGPADCLYLGGAPACVVGYDGDYTWFLATPAYYAGGVKVLRHAKRYWAEVATKREVLSRVADRPELLRWLGMLGFEVVEKSGGSALLRLRSTKPTDPAIPTAERA